MAYDKVIDSGKLNSALTATANAIRSKTGKTAKIAWDESTGFASDVNSISIGGEDQPGLCSAVNINCTGYDIKNAFATTDGIYTAVKPWGIAGVPTIYDVDVNRPIFIFGTPAGSSFTVTAGDNVEILATNNKDAFCFKCTSTNFASLTVIST